MQFYPLLDSMRAILIIGATIYLIYSLESLVHFEGKRNLSSSDRIRIGLSFFSFLLTSCIFLFTFSFGNETANNLFLPVVFCLGAINTFLYTRLLKPYLAWPELVVKFVSVGSGLVLLTGIIIIVVFLMTGDSLGWEFRRDQSIENSFSLASYGYYRYVPIKLGLFASALAAIVTVIVLISLFFAIFQGKNTDKFIIAGVVFTFLAMTLELVVPILFPRYIFSIYFAAYIPEIVRVSYLARRRLIEELLDKERETIMSVAGTLRHELNTPIATIGGYISLAKKLNDLKPLDKCDAVIERISNILTQLDKLADSNLNRTSYRSDQKSMELSKSIYVLKNSERK